MFPFLKSLLYHPCSSPSLTMCLFWPEGVWPQRCRALRAFLFEYEASPPVYVFNIRFLLSERFWEMRCHWLGVHVSTCIPFACPRVQGGVCFFTKIHIVVSQHSRMSTLFYLPFVFDVLLFLSCDHIPASPACDLRHSNVSHFSMNSYSVFRDCSGTLMLLFIENHQYTLYKKLVIWRKSFAEET